ncbi:hypothetical protein BBK82_33520 [Lentzea guizhouensis]|uniref:Uncharacterized protein n=1 Tax=Lentzea guizhouensis TaxID=1586287 RepID=A0A1B2HR87_9PSEU|nr:hypothetical protein BBK82_33520 [Lentzea guizhouensis]
MYDADVISAVRMIQRFVPGMRARGWGRVIQIGGGLGSQPLAVQPTTAPLSPPVATSSARTRTT